MRFPAFWLALGFSLGVLSTPLSLKSEWVSTAFFAGLPFLWVARGHRLFLPLMIVLLVALGMLYGRLDQTRPKNAVEAWAEVGAHGRAPLLVLEGTVASQPEAQTKGKKVTLSFILDSNNLMRWVSEDNVIARSPEGTTKQSKNPQIASGTSYPRNDGRGRREFFEVQGKVQVFLFQPPGIPEIGDCVRLSGTLAKPRPVSNPGEFDYAHYLAERDIYSVLTGFGARSLLRSESGDLPFWLRAVFRLRQKIVERIELLYPDPDSALVFKALTVGIRKGLRPELRDDFMKTGTTHLLAISGLNITLVAGSFYWSLMALRLGQKSSAALALLVVLGYVLVAGLGIPVQRAGWMAGAGFLALLLERERNILNFFCLAFWILLLVDTRNLTNVSFQLSFLSVFSLIAILPRWMETWRWKEGLLDSAAVMAGTFPLVLYYFHVFSPVSILANMIAVPLFHLALLALLLSLVLGSVPLVGFCVVKMASVILDSGLAWIHALAQYPWGYTYLTKPNFGQLLFYYGTLSFLLFLRFHSLAFEPTPGVVQRPPLGWAFRRVRGRWIRACAMALWIFATSTFFWPHPGPDFSLTFLAAGKSELAHIELGRGRHWLINTGRGLPSDQGQWIVAPYLRSKGIKHLAGILVTDFYARHTGALPTLLRNFSSDYFFFPATEKETKVPWQELARRKINQVKLMGGERIRVKPPGEIRILAEPRGQLILLISYGEWDFLLLPALNFPVLEALKPYRKLLLEVEGLFLPAMTSVSDSLTVGAVREPPLLNDLMDLIDPEIITLPEANSEFKTFFGERDITLLDLKERGAVTLSLPSAASALLIKTERPQPQAPDQIPPHHKALAPV